MDYVQATHSYRDARDGEVGVWDDKATEHWGDRGGSPADNGDSIRSVRAKILTVYVCQMYIYVYVISKNDKKGKNKQPNKKKTFYQPDLEGHTVVI